MFAAIKHSSARSLVGGQGGHIAAVSNDNQRHDPPRAPAAQIGPKSAVKSSKSQALAAFHGAVTKSRQDAPFAAAPGVGSGSTGQQSQTAAAAHGGVLATPGVELAGRSPVAAAAATAAPCAATPPSTSPQLLSRAVKALQRLLQQLQGRSLPYLYQFDALLRTARDAMSALAAAASADPARLAGQDLQPAAGDGATAAGMAAAVQEMLGACTLSWRACHLLLKHHHAAEPENALQQAKLIGDPARVVWEACEAAQAATSANTPVLQQAGDGSGDADFLGRLTAMIEVAGSWAGAGANEAADWCCQQLHKHLSTVSRLGDDRRLHLASRQQLQRLQLRMLQGSMGVAARAGQQALWANLSCMLKQLLEASVLDTEETISFCLEMAGCLSEHATSLAQPPAATPAVATLPASRNSAACADTCRVLELAVQLLDVGKQQTAALQEHCNNRDSSNEASAAISLQVSGIQQQVLLQLGEAYVAHQQFGRAADCVNKLQGCAAGLALVPGFVRLSSRALLGQGKLRPAVAQLCAWLQQGGQTPHEACSAVVAFVQALHATGAGTPLQAGAVGEAVQQLAAAAVERCKADPDVAVAMALQLLALSEEGSSQHSLEQLAVQLLSVEEVAQKLLRTSDDCQRCHALLHGRAQTHYQHQRFAAAIALLTPAVFFSTSVTAGKTARLLAACLVKTQQPDKALQYAALAERQQGAATSLGCVISLQAGLMQAQAGDSAAAVTAAIGALRSCPQTDDRATQAALLLCMEAGDSAAAWQVLRCCHDSAAAATVAAAGTSASGKGGLSQMLHVLSLMHSIWVVHQEEDSSRLPELCRTYCSCVEAATGSSAAAALPAAAAAGDRGAVGVKQLMWLADLGLQLGTRCAAAPACTQACLAVLQHAAKLLQELQGQSAASQTAGAATPAQQQQQLLGDAAAVSLGQRHVAALAAAVALLLHGPDTAEQPSAAQQRQCLQAACKLARAAEEQLQRLNDDAGAGWLADMQLLLTKQAFTLACRQQQEHEMKRCLQRLVQQPGVSAADFQSAAAECLEPGLPGGTKPAVAALAYGYMMRVAACAAAASKEQQQPETAAAGMAAVAAAVAGILTGPVPSHGVRLKVVAKVAELLGSSGQAASSVASTGYPPQQLRWLITVCWNDAVQLASSQAELAGQYLSAAATLARLQQQQTGDGQQKHWLLASPNYATLQQWLSQQLQQPDAAAGSGSSVPEEGPRQGSDVASAANAPAAVAGAGSGGSGQPSEQGAAPSPAAAAAAALLPQHVGSGITSGATQQPGPEQQASDKGGRLQHQATEVVQEMPEGKRARSSHQQLAPAAGGECFSQAAVSPAWKQQQQQQESDEQQVAGQASGEDAAEAAAAGGMTTRSSPTALAIDGSSARRYVGSQEQGPAPSQQAAALTQQPAGGRPGAEQQERRDEGLGAAAAASAATPAAAACDAVEPGAAMPAVAPEAAANSQESQQQQQQQQRQQEGSHGAAAASGAGKPPLAAEANTITDDASAEDNCQRTDSCRAAAHARQPATDTEMAEPPAGGQLSSGGLAEAAVGAEEATAADTAAGFAVEGGDGRTEQLAAAIVPDAAVRCAAAATPASAAKGQDTAATTAGAGCSQGSAGADDSLGSAAAAAADAEGLWGQELQLMMTPPLCTLADDDGGLALALGTPLPAASSSQQEVSDIGNEPMAIDGR